MLSAKVEHSNGPRDSLAGCRCAERSDNELAYAHAYSTPEEQRAAAILVEDENSGNGGDNVDCGWDHADQELIVDAGVLKVLSTVVENEVDACSN